METEIEMTPGEQNILRAIERGYNLMVASLPKGITEPKIKDDKVIALIKRNIGILDVMANEEHYFHSEIIKEISNLKTLINRL